MSGTYLCFLPLLHSAIWIQQFSTPSLNCPLYFAGCAELICSFSTVELWQKQAGAQKQAGVTNIQAASWCLQHSTGIANIQQREVPIVARQ